MKSLQRSLDEAKTNHGKLPVRFIKILLTGSGAAGKTSFGNLLMRKEFIKSHHSTNIVQVKHSMPVIRAISLESNGESDEIATWLEMDKISQAMFLRQVLTQSKFHGQQRNCLHNMPVKTKSTSSTGISTSRSLSTSDPELNKHTTASKCKWENFKLPKILNNMFKTSVNSSDLLSLNCLVECGMEKTASEYAMVSHQTGEALNVITILDTGGQPEYLHLLPTVNIQPAITFLIHDLSKKLEEKVTVKCSEHGKPVFEPFHLQYSNSDMIKFLMCSINDSIEKPDLKVPELVTIPGNCSASYLCFVETHADKVDRETIQIVDNTLTNMVEKLDCRAAIWQNENNGVYYSQSIIQLLEIKIQKTQ